jgi:peptide/nickel transport system substrate-binding protein
MPSYDGFLVNYYRSAPSTRARKNWARNNRVRFRVRQSPISNLERVTTNGNSNVIFHLKQPQPAFLTALASGFSPIYPCHLAARDMHQHPIGTRPFKFGEFSPNEYVTVMRSPDYWKKNRPLLDGIEYTIDVAFP